MKNKNGNLMPTMLKKSRSNSRKPIKYIDLFCGVGGFHYAASSYGMKSVFASDIDPYCQESYFANFGIKLYGDITKIDASDIPNHDILFGGFPCQPFSIIGAGRGFQDARGTLFFDVARIIEEKNPRGFILENVKQLAGHNNGKTIKRIVQVLSDMGYNTDWRVLNALNFGVPQKRERVLIVGVRDRALNFNWDFPRKPMLPLSKILEKDIDKKHFASKHIVAKRLTKHSSEYQPAIWHENKSGNISSYPYSCALRANASYNYLLVDGKRRLTPREMFRLQGFPDSFKIVTNDSQARKQAGNAVPVPIVKAVLGRLIDVLERSDAPQGVPIINKKLPSLVAHR
jgi:DNA (cytosine-5)-methyltransferase 1